jgi:prefoldin subunit 5
LLIFFTSRIDNQRIIELEAQMEDLRDKQILSANEDHSDLRRKVNELQRRIKDLESDEEQSKVLIEANQGWNMVNVYY